MKRITVTTVALIALGALTACGHKSGDSALAPTEASSDSTRTTSQTASGGAKAAPGTFEACQLASDTLMEDVLLAPIVSWGTPPTQPVDGVVQLPNGDGSTGTTKRSSGWRVTGTVSGCTWKVSSATTGSTSPGNAPEHFDLEALYIEKDENYFAMARSFGSGASPAWCPDTSNEYRNLGSCLFEKDIDGKAMLVLFPVPTESEATGAGVQAMEQRLGQLNFVDSVLKSAP